MRVEQTVRLVKTLPLVTRGLVFIQNYHITDLESFTAGVNEQCSVREIVKADRIRQRNQNTQVYMITFKCDKLPEYIRIPGECCEWIELGIKRCVGELE